MQKFNVSKFNALIDEYIRSSEKKIYPSCRAYSDTRGKIRFLFLVFDEGLRLNQIEKLTRDMASGPVDSRKKVRNRQAYICRLLKKMVEEGRVEKYKPKGSDYPHYRYPPIGG
ncbi:hypothetical protein AKJ56_01750 [candidate division MSBL1 archaeon SCGC-AAA382N08]|uniref:Uncharacterized protein n=1 Tax=candidate division MSBL1 archaeon SCGC-AAA382N08 TaxID=1698285 RepID=A0A133VNZ8_9EURY|nr:hypothetical protein AKJ56_01750 [candidate division MSBL1 archaeon SCGC-AAA382N08]